MGLPVLAEEGEGVGEVNLLAAADTAYPVLGAVVDAVNGIVGGALAGVDHGQGEPGRTDDRLEGPQPVGDDEPDGKRRLLTLSGFSARTGEADREDEGREDGDG